MYVPTIDIRKNSLVRYGFKSLLEREFDICLHEDDIEKLELARACIEIYETEQEFWDKTGWKRDNPEIGDFQYLQEEHICRMVDGKVWYFSGIRYADGLKQLMQEKHEYAKKHN